MRRRPKRENPMAVRLDPAERAEIRAIRAELERIHGRRLSQSEVVRALLARGIRIAKETLER